MRVKPHSARARAGAPAAGRGGRRRQPTSRPVEKRPKGAGTPGKSAEARGRASGTALKDPRLGHKGPTVCEVIGVDKAGGEVEMVLTGGASGHVMQPRYGGRPISVVEGYGKSDTIYLTHKRPGASRSTEVIKVQSRAGHPGGLQG